MEPIDKNIVTEQVRLRSSREREASIASYAVQGSAYGLTIHKRYNCGEIEAVLRRVKLGQVATVRQT
ncbi:MAG: hypothetical protein OEZ48_16545 [Candidatus Bathyarchaeota archaeon]|nr:hypothetical protein [Candidatus Bathyarchaeota archaeon]MDH5689460.1 hypothetical protein [Candidatus Bathyarchaeota archaeon]